MSSKKLEDMTDEELDRRLAELREARRLEEQEWKGVEAENSVLQQEVEMSKVRYEKAVKFKAAMKKGKKSNK